VERIQLVSPKWWAVERDHSTTRVKPQYNQDDTTPTLGRTSWIVLISNSSPRDTIFVLHSQGKCFSVQPWLKTPVTTLHTFTQVSIIYKARLFTRNHLTNQKFWRSTTTLGCWTWQRKNKKSAACSWPHSLAVLVITAQAFKVSMKKELNKEMSLIKSASFKQDLYIMVD